MKLKSILLEISNLNDIKKLSDITDEMIPHIISDNPCVGYNDKKDALEGFSYIVEEWRSLPDPVKLYRVIGVVDKHAINDKELGFHWTYDPEILDDDFLHSIAFGESAWLDWDGDGDPPEIVPYVVVANVPHSKINIPATIAANLEFPKEKEIQLKDNGRGLGKLVDIYRL